jgi:carboxylate-amine ligase
VEEEFQLVHPTTFDLVSRVDTMLGLATDADRKQIKQELLQSVIESATKVCANAAEAREDLVALRRRIIELADQAECRVASAGTHPFSRYEFQKVTDAERYQDIISRLKWVAQRELIFGLHVHVGMDSPEKCMHVFNEIRSYLPELLALSANSPYWQGRHTGLASSRSKVFDSFPRSGLPQPLDSWQDFEALVGRAVSVGALADYTYIWWDVRPHPRFGTIEIRACDAQTHVDESVALAALIQATCAWLGDRFDRGKRAVVHPQFLIAENKWSASRYGLDGDMIDFANDSTRSTRDSVRWLVEQVEPFARRLGSAEQLATIGQLLERNGAARQLDVYAHSESLMSVGEMLVRRATDV